MTDDFAKRAAEAATKYATKRSRRYILGVLKEECDVLDYDMFDAFKAGAEWAMSQPVPCCPECKRLWDEAERVKAERDALAAQELNKPVFSNPNVGMLNSSLTQMHMEIYYLRAERDALKAELKSKTDHGLRIIELLNDRREVTEKWIECRNATETFRNSMYALEERVLSLKAELEQANGLYADQSQDLKTTYANVKIHADERHRLELLAESYGSILREILTYFDKALDEYGEGLQYRLARSDAFERARDLLIKDGK